jgi:hypothetical protein
LTAAVNEDFFKCSEKSFVSIIIIWESNVQCTNRIDNILQIHFRLLTCKNKMKVSVPRPIYIVFLQLLFLQFLPTIAERILILHVTYDSMLKDVRNVHTLTQPQYM